MKASERPMPDELEPGYYWMMHRGVWYVIYWEFDQYYHTGSEEGSSRNDAIIYNYTGWVRIDPPSDKEDA